MEATSEERPQVLLVDDRVARIEFLENVLFHRGFEVRVVSHSGLHAELARATPTVIVSYLTIDVGQAAAARAPIIMLVEDPTDRDTVHDDDGTAVIYLRRTVGCDVLASKIASLVLSASERSTTQIEDRGASQTQHQRVVDGRDKEST